MSETHLHKLTILSGPIRPSLDHPSQHRRNPEHVEDVPEVCVGERRERRDEAWSKAQWGREQEECRNQLSNSSMVISHLTIEGNKVFQVFGLLWPQHGSSSNDSQMCALCICSLDSWVCGMAEQPCFGFSLCTVEYPGRVHVGSSSVFILLSPGAMQSLCEKSQNAALWASCYRHFHSRSTDVTKSNPTSLSGKASCIHTSEQYLRVT